MCDESFFDDLAIDPEEPTFESVSYEPPVWVMLLLQFSSVLRVPTLLQTVFPFLLFFLMMTLVTKKLFMEI
jgi:hypothetical protein